MREFDLLIEHTAGKENLLADSLSRKHKYSLDHTEEKGFIPQSIDPTEDTTEPLDSCITTNNLSISPIREEITMVPAAASTSSTWTATIISAQAVKKA